MDLGWLTESRPWVDFALCAQTYPEAFFPEQGGWSSVREAKAICSACEVPVQCLAYAVDNRIAFGIYGGTTARERRGMLASQRSGTRHEHAKGRANACRHR